MKVNKFSLLILTLVFCVCSVFVSAKENESKATRQVSSKNVPCQQNENLLFQQKPIEQVSYKLSEINSGTRLNNGYPLFAFAMPQPIFAFQTFDLLDGTRGGPEYSWVCVAACVAVLCGGGTNPGCVNNCLSSCIVN